MNLGQKAAYLRWHDGLGWTQIVKKLGIQNTEQERERIRSRARRYKSRNPDEFQEAFHPETDSVSPFRWEEAFNHATITANTPLIKTLDQLLEFGQVDLSVWKVDRHILNAWPVGAKAEKKDLTFKDGKIDGTIESSGLIFGQLMQVKAWLSRIEPLSIHPVIQPVECKTQYRKPKYPQRNGIQRSLIFADSQIGFSEVKSSAALKPFHDRRVLDIMLQVAESAKPQRVDILGDYLDLVMWTDKFLRSPKFEYCTQPAICEGHWWLAQLREILPEAQITLHEGNHDFRMRTAIMLHLRAAYGLKAADELELPAALSPPRLLALHKLRIEWKGDYPKNEDWLNDAVQIKHGHIARGTPGDTAKVISRDSDSTQIFGHIHRVEYVGWTAGKRRKIQTRYGFCPGCACHIDYRVPGHNPNQKWQQGIAIVDYEVDGEQFAISPILVDNGKAVWNGRLFTARNRLADLKTALPKWNWRD